MEEDNGQRRRWTKEKNEGYESSTMVSGIYGFVLKSQKAFRSVEHTLVCHLASSQRLFSQ